MDSENEVIIVDEIVATNGLNGHSEDLGEMKTRSKTSEADVVKSKVRCTRNVGSQDKGGSDTEKKDKKVVENKPPSKEPTATKSVPQDKTASASAAKKSTTKVIDEQPTVLLQAKKKNTDREDDSGINSRASSVSNEDVTPARMRTRSSRSSDIASTSTPAKKGQGRMPLSTYDFEDIAFDEEILQPASLKRKAAMIVEEMEEVDEEKQMDTEPAAKRPALAATTNFFNAFLNPLRALRGKFASKSQPTKTDETSTSEEVASHEISKGAKVDTVDTTKENVSQPETSEEVSESTNQPQTCRIM